TDRDGALPELPEPLSDRTRRDDLRLVRLGAPVRREARRARPAWELRGENPSGPRTGFGPAAGSLRTRGNRHGLGLRRTVHVGRAGRRRTVGAPGRLPHSLSGGRE